MVTKLPRKLIKKVPYKAGRTRQGIMVRHKGGRAKRLYRDIDFKSRKFDIKAQVKEIVYDPNRTSNIALIVYKDGEKAFILAPHSLKLGDEVAASRSALPVKTGNRMPLKYIPSGTQVFNIELKPGKGAQAVRSAGAAAQVRGEESGKIGVKLPSGEVRLFPAESLATIGQVGNVDHRTRILGKAGRARHLGRRPTVRGTAMSAGAHPHGGGEGRTGEGRIPKTPWGKPARGVKTRKKKKPSSKFIIKRRR